MANKINLDNHRRIEVTPHAIDRLRERFGFEGDDAEAIELITTSVRKGSLDQRYKSRRRWVFEGMAIVTAIRQPTMHLVVSTVYRTEKES